MPCGTHRSFQISSTLQCSLKDEKPSALVPLNKPYKTNRAVPSLGGQREGEGSLGLQLVTQLHL